MSSRRRAAKLNIREKLEISIQEGKLYEALQMIKTVYSRQFAKGNIDRADKHLVEGIMILLKHDEFLASEELCKLLINGWRGQKLKVIDSRLDVVMNIHGAFKAPVKEQVEFMKLAIKWTSECGSKLSGSPILHILAAKTQAQLGNLKLASFHFTRSEAPEKYASMLIEWSNHGYRGERDLFIARAVFGLLILKNLRDANIVFQSSVKILESESITFDSPLMHFIEFILATLERDALPLFELLEKKYRYSITRDPQFSKSLETIKLKFYNKRPASSNNGILNLMNSMFSGK